MTTTSLHLSRLLTTLSSPNVMSSNASVSLIVGPLCVHLLSLYAHVWSSSGEWGTYPATSQRTYSLWFSFLGPTAPPPSIGHLTGRSSAGLFQVTTAAVSGCPFPILLFKSTEITGIIIKFPLPNSGPLKIHYGHHIGKHLLKVWGKAGVTIWVIDLQCIFYS